MVVTGSGPGAIIAFSAGEVEASVPIEIEDASLRIFEREGAVPTSFQLLAGAAK